MVAFGEYSDDGTASTLKSRDYKDATDLIAFPSIAFPAFMSGTQVAATEELAPAMGAENQTAVAYPIQEVGKRTGTSTTDPRAGIGIADDGEPMYTLQAGAQHGVAAYAFQPRIARNGRGDMGDVVNALNAQSGETGKGDAAPCVAVGFYANEGSLGSGNNVEMSPTLKAHPKTSNLAAVATAMAVRRLTPVECERLQGFPDDYTAIPWKKKPADVCPDGPRYKALGNSMAVPCMQWIGKRIQEALL